LGVISRLLVTAVAAPIDIAPIVVAPIVVAPLSLSLSLSLCHAGVVLCVLNR
jgi:hypothetical protein